MSKPLCLVTGTTHGIGLVCAREIAIAGFRVVMACRDPARAALVKDHLIKVSGNTDIHILQCDLSSLQSVRDCADAFHEQFDSLELLINNAGMMTNVAQLSVDGFELTFACNHLGPYLLTRLLLDILQRGQRARIVNVASAIHNSGKLELDNLASLSKYSGMKAYSRSKLANVMFTLSLAERLANTDVTANCLHPGVVATNIIPDTSPLLKLGGRLIKGLMLNEERGAQTSLYLALSDEVETVSGKYYNQHQQITEPSVSAQDPAARAALWSASEAMVGLSPC